MASRFTHLHTHSHYSFLQALPKIDELVEKAKKEGMDTLALTDSGNMHGAIEFYKSATEAGIKPVLGVDTYLAPRSRFDKDVSLDAKRSRIVLLAENNAGYKNLLSIVTKSYTEGFFERPRVDKDLLRKHSEGVIAILPSFSSDIAQLLRAGDTDGACGALADFKDIFGSENIFLEITHHPSVEGHELLMQKLITFAKENNTPLLAQHDVYYLDPSDREPTEILRRIGQGGHGKNEKEDFSFISEKKACELFKDTPDALDNTRKIADRCNLSFDLGKWTFPSAPVSKGFKNHDEELRAKAYAGIATYDFEKTKELVDRIEYELDIIIGKGFAVYYLIVADLLRFAKTAGILTTTRGSAAGSLVAYLIGITNVNPMFYKLPFERFLNPQRPKAPDIDMDMADNRRDDMIAYTKQKYGADHVAQIGTFGTMMARAAVRDVARALGHSYTVGDHIAKLIPIGSQGFPMTIKHAMELEPDLKSLYKEDEDTHEIIDMALHIEGCVRHVGVHAAGVVVSPTPLVEWTPLQPDPKGTGKLITQYDMYSITDEYGGVGLLKFDFLGIKNLSILADAVVRVKETQNIDIDIENVPIDDAKTYQMLARGETEGVFQLNGSGMTRWLKELQPNVIHDINAMVALYRPGPMENIPAYIERKKNPRLIKFLDERMKEYLDFSYGIIVYQDDVLMTAIKLGGYSWLEADKLRKAMGKKIPAVMQAEKEKLMKGFAEYGKLSKEKSEKIWSLIEPFAAYGFNKCLTADTRIINGDTNIPERIDTLLKRNCNSKVCALDSSGRIAIAKSTPVRKNGDKDIFLLTTRSGRTIRATANHPFFAFSGWTRLDKLMPGARIAVPRSLPEPAKTIPMTHHEAVVLGYLITEGNLCHPHGIYYYAKAEDEIKDFIKSAEMFANAKITIDRSKSATSVYVGQKDVHCGNAMREWLDTLGLIGKKATEKSIPEVAFSVNNKTLAVMLGKLWQGDGAISVKNTQAFYATSSRILAEDVQHLLLRFDITSTIHTKSFAYRNERKVGWTVVITARENITTFAKAIGIHLIGKKQVDLQTLVLHSAQRTNNLGRGTADTIPAEILTMIRSEMSKKKISTAQLAEQASISERLLGTDARKSGITRNSLYKIATALNSKPLLEQATSDIFWDEVVSIVPDGHEMTYDISVPRLENFVANGIVVHNSHAASYGKVAYQTAYMKANYPIEYMSAVLTADSGDTDQIAIFVAETKRMNIPVLPPDINESGAEFTVVRAPASAEATSDKVIRFGLSSIKNFGDGISEAIISERKAHGQFTSLSDFLSRIKSKNLHRRALESLIKCGALDSLNEDADSRNTMLKNIELMLTFHREATAEAPQDSLFGTLSTPPLVLSKGDTTTLLDKLAWEKELLGIYVSGHPLDAYKDITKKSRVTISKILEESKAGMPIILPVLISVVRPILTKSGEKMSFITLEDTTGLIEAVIFPKLFKTHTEIIVPGKCILIKGKVSIRNGEKSIVIDELKPL